MRRAGGRSLGLALAQTFDLSSHPPAQEGAGCLQNWPMARGDERVNENGERSEISIQVPLTGYRDSSVNGPSNLRESRRSIYLNALYEAASIEAA